MLELAKELNCEKQIVLGYRDELFLLDEFRKQGEVYIATEDGVWERRAMCSTPSARTG